MADKDKATGGSAKATEADRQRARLWFKKAADSREKQSLDYAIECYITGLGYWPEAVEEGHMPLRSVAIQRAQAGGKKPGMMDGLKKSMTVKDARQAMLNAEHLLSMDPTNGGYAEGVLRNAVRAGYLEVAKWVAPLVFESLRKDKKPNKGRFKTFRDLMVEAAGQADANTYPGMETWFLEQAVQSLEYLIARMPTDEELKNEQRDLAGKLTISRGKYEEAGDFRESLRDAEKQKLLHDSERVRQSEDTLEALIAAARREWEAAPDNPGRIMAYVNALRKDESKPHEDEAIRVLMQAYERSRTYAFKVQADDIRLQQLARVARALITQANESGSEEDRQQARLAALEHRQTTIDVYRERVAEYPTDLRLKYHLGRALFEAGEYDEAIPLLQAGQADPKHRNRCQYLIGRAFLEKNNPAQAAEVLRETLAGYELTDEFSKELMYWLGRAYEAAGDVDNAKNAYGRLLRIDYNYMNGDARKRLDGLNK